MIKECLTFYTAGLKRKILNGDVKVKAYKNFTFPRDIETLEKEAAYERVFSPGFVASWNADSLVEHVIREFGYNVKHAYSDSTYVNKYVEVRDDEDLKSLQERLKFLRKIGISIDA